MIGNRFRLCSGVSIKKCIMEVNLESDSCSLIFNRSTYIFRILLLTVSLIACQPTQGESGLGDPYHPGLGNGGYDVEHYDIVLDIDPVENLVRFDVTIKATAIHRLRGFNLDFGSLGIDSLEVNGSSASYSQQGNELTVTPSEPIGSGMSFTVHTIYHGNPEPTISYVLGIPVGWHHSEDGSINVINWPDGAGSWFPGNHHQSDLSTFRFDVSVPDPWVVVAPGEESIVHDVDSGDRHVFEVDVPMASVSAVIYVDNYDVAKTIGPDGVYINTYVPGDAPELVSKFFGEIPAILEYFVEMFGTYPFQQYSLVIADPNSPFCRSGVANAEETLSLHCPNNAATRQSILAHELAHQWFGLSVVPQNFKDAWLGEGPATYAQWMWLSQVEPDTDLDTIVKNKEAQYRSVFLPSSPIGNPPDEVVSNAIYTGGALLLHALRQEVGDEAFFDILRIYLDRFQYSTASTSEFIGIANEVADHDLDEFFDGWLTQVKPPPVFHD